MPRTLGILFGKSDRQMMSVALIEAQIIQTVVRAITADVMNNFGTFKRTP